MLAVFSARQLAQGYNFTHNPFIYEEFLCLFQVIGNEHMTPSLIDPQISNFQNGCFFFSLYQWSDISGDISCQIL